MIAFILCFMVGVFAQQQNPRNCLNAVGDVDCTVICSGKDACQDTIQFRFLNSGRLLVVCENGGPACNSLNIQRRVGSGTHYLFCNGATRGSANCNSVTVDRSVQYCCGTRNNGCNSHEGGIESQDACIRELPARITCSEETLLVPNSDYDGNSLNHVSSGDSVTITCDPGYQSTLGEPTLEALCNHLGDWVVGKCVPIPDTTTDPDPDPDPDPVECTMQNTWEAGDFSPSNAGDVLQSRPALFTLEPICPTQPFPISGFGEISDLEIWDITLSEAVSQGVEVHFNLPGSGNNLETNIHRVSATIKASFQFRYGILIRGFITFTIRDLEGQALSQIPSASVPADQARLSHTCVIRSNVLSVSLTAENFASRATLRLLEPFVNQLLADSPRMSELICFLLPTDIQQFIRNYIGNDDKALADLMARALPAILLNATYA